MSTADRTAPSQTESISFEFDLSHSPEKVWRALTDPGLLAEWLLPVLDLDLQPGAAFTFKTQPYPGWDGAVNCRILEIDAPRKLSYTWVVGDMGLDTVVTFTLTPTATGTRLSLVQSGFKPTQKQNFGGARYGWKMMGEKLVDLLGEDPMNYWIRQIHRWLSIVFTVTVIANFVVIGMKKQIAWVTYSPLPPLALLLFSGLYMFMLPYAARWRGARRAD